MVKRMKDDQHKQSNRMGKRNEKLYGNKFGSIGWRFKVGGSRLEVRGDGQEKQQMSDGGLPG